MKIRYVGPSTSGVDIPAANVHAPRGEPVDVPDDIAVMLLAQATFEAVAPATRRGKE